MCTCLPDCSDRPDAIGFSVSRHTSSREGWPTKLARVSSAGFVLSTTYHLILMTALKSRLTNFLCLLPLAELVMARIARTCARCATTVSSSPSPVDTFFGPLPPIFFSFIACFSSLVGRRGEDFSFCFPVPEAPGPRGSSTSNVLTRSVGLY